MFFYLLIGSVVAIWAYVFASLRSLYREKKGFHKNIFILHTVMLFILFGNPLLVEKVLSFKPILLYSLTYYLSLSVLSYLILSLMIKDFLLLPVLLKSKNIQQESKREFIRKAFSVFALTNSALIPALGYAQASRPKLKDVVLELENFPSEFGEFRIIQVSDLHVGPLIREDYIRYIRAFFDRKKPHMIFYTGDMVDGSVKNLGPEFAPIKNYRAPFGNYFVTGNHEYYSGVESWMKFFQEEMGCEVLMNQHKTVELGGKTLKVAGVSDYRAHRFNPSHRSDPYKAFGNKKADYDILLAHQPRSAFKAAGAGFDFMCCGHTHGGQSFPFSLLVHLFQPYVKGLYKRKKMKIYVNSGAGYWGPPNRFGVGPEVTHFIFRNKVKV